MEYNFTEEQKGKIASLSSEEFVKYLIHHTRAPIHSCISTIELLQFPEIQLNEEQTQLIAFMERQLLSIKRNHEEMYLWLDIHRSRTQ